MGLVGTKVGTNRKDAHVADSKEEKLRRPANNSKLEMSELGHIGLEILKGLRELTTLGGHDYMHHSFYPIKGTKDNRFFFTSDVSAFKSYKGNLDGLITNSWLSDFSRGFGMPEIESHAYLCARQIWNKIFEKNPRIKEGVLKLFANYLENLSALKPFFIDKCREDEAKNIIVYLTTLALNEVALMIPISEIKENQVLTRSGRSMSEVIASFELSDYQVDVYKILDKLYDGSKLLKVMEDLIMRGDTPNKIVKMVVSKFPGSMEYHNLKKVLNELSDEAQVITLQLVLLLDNYCTSILLKSTERHDLGVRYLISYINKLQGVTSTESDLLPSKPNEMQAIEQLKEWMVLLDLTDEKLVRNSYGIVNVFTNANNVEKLKRHLSECCYSRSAVLDIFSVFGFDKLIEMGVITLNYNTQEVVDTFKRSLGSSNSNQLSIPIRDLQSFSDAYLIFDPPRMPWIDAREARGYSENLEPIDLVGYAAMHLNHSGVYESQDFPASATEIISRFRNRRRSSFKL